jgi:hypothetical protein
MSRRRQQRRAEKTRRHAQVSEPAWPTDATTSANPPRVVVRQARYVERLAYTRSQAAQALGISRSTLRRLLPYVETIEMPWGGKLIPVDELKRLVAERRLAATAKRPNLPAGRKPSVPVEIVHRIRAERIAGKSLREIADCLNADGTPTAHGGAQWWPSTVRSVLARSHPLGFAETGHGLA